MKEYCRLRSAKGITLLEVAIVLSVIVIVAAILFPVLTIRDHPSAPKSTCQSHMKELATATQMYWNDYNGNLPSSVLHQEKGAKGWDAKASAEFCSQLGEVPPLKSPWPSDIHWVQLLWPYMKNKDVIWCPKDSNKPHDEWWGLKRVEPTPTTLMSYIWKPATDRAWFGLEDSSGTRYFRNEQDFEFVADQMLMFERLGWHWGNEKDWSDGVMVMASFLDGHVRPVRFKNAVGHDAPKTASELADLMKKPGEPLWYNAREAGQDKLVSKKAVWFDPRVCFDDLP